MAESGVPGYVAGSWNGLLVPAGTPQPVIERLEGALAVAVNDPNVVRVLFQSGAEKTVTTSDEFGQFLRAEIVKWREVIEKADIRPD
jgi:tripartite-type tricarboxylate transporter receptor subunit TctC